MRTEAGSVTVQHAGRPSTMSSAPQALNSLGRTPRSGQSGAMDDEPELYIIDPSGRPGAAEWREDHERQKAAARARYLELVVAEIELLGAVEDPALLTDSLFALLFVHRYRDDHECSCSCHPRLPTSDLHDFGFACPCGFTADERRASFERSQAEVDAYWDSTEGQAATARREAEEAELATWIADQPGVGVASHASSTRQAGGIWPAVSVERRGSALNAARGSTPPSDAEFGRRCHWQCWNSSRSRRRGLDGGDALGLVGAAVGRRRIQAEPPQQGAVGDRRHRGDQ